MRARFFAAGAGSQPQVDRDYYLQNRALGFDPQSQIAGFEALRVRITNQMGDSAVGSLMTSRVDEYMTVIEMLGARGTTAFTPLSTGLYGGVNDLTHPGGPSLLELGEIMDDALTSIADGPWEAPEGRSFDASVAVKILGRRLSSVWGDEQISVILDDGIVADAAAGSDYIKLRADAEFTDRDLRVLEVHEGWVHVATSLNGRRQPWCTFLGKGTPSTTVTQEGLAVFSEITTLSSTPSRLAKITRRMHAIGMAASGATFLDVYRWFIDEGLDDANAWTSAVRVFRGSTPTGGPFTKDLVYIRGFLEVYDAMRLAVRKGLLDRLPLLWVGKLAIRELGLFSRLTEQGVVARPAILPPNVSDVSALAAWLAFSNLLNRIDLAAMEVELGSALD